MARLPTDDAATPDVDETMEMMGDVDTVSYARLENGVEKSLAAGNDDGIAGIENIIGSQGIDTLTGSDGDNVIEGGESGDTLTGGGPVGAETRNADPSIIGDTLSYAGSDDWVRVTLNGTDQATTSRGHASGDTANGFENIRGSAHDDDLTGDGNANRLWGGDGDDVIKGLAGDDVIEGGAGADELDGGTHTENGSDILSYASSDAGVTVNLATASASGGHATGDTIETVEVDHDGDSLTEDDDTQDGTDERVDSAEIDVATFENVIGSMHNDRITGDHRMNVLMGGAGDDILPGRS